MPSGHSCPVCQAPLVSWFRSQGRSLGRCTDCGLARVLASDSQLDESAKAYTDGKPIFLRDGNADYYLDDTMLESSALKVRWLKDYLGMGARLLDVGAGFGHFLNVASSDFEATGIEISEYAAQWGRDRFGVANTVGDLYEHPVGDGFDAVTCWDVIEHVADPDRALQRLSEYLPRNGMLFLSTPDISSPVARLLGTRWHYIDPLQHLTLFSRKGLRSLLLKSGFEPMGWRTFGHYYRVSYILRRLQNLHSESLAAPILNGLRRAIGPLDKLKVFIRLGDVMAVAARRR